MTLGPNCAMQLYPRESHVPVYPSLSLLKGESLRHCGCCLSALRTIAYAKSLQTASKIAEVALTGASLNFLVPWLREMDGLRRSNLFPAPVR